MSRTPKKLPKGAKKVFEGVLFDVWQWPQKVFDGSIQTFERLGRPDTAKVIAVIGNKILILDERQPHMKNSIVTFPGGRIEKGEQALVGAKRELLEEVGYKAKKWVLQQKTSPNEWFFWNAFIYIAKDCEKVGNPILDGGEKIKAKLISFEQFLLLSDNPHFSEKYLNGILLKARYNTKEKLKLKRLLFS